MKHGILIVFVKAPQAGRVKTRLGREIGAGRAAEIFRALTALTLAQALKLRTRFNLVLAVDPPAAIRGWTHLWPRAFARVAQGDGDLGRRLRAAIAGAPGGGGVVIIGADAPGMRAEHLKAAFKALARADAVVGPAEDGGFWLIGFARRPACQRPHKESPRLFEGVRWSTAHALTDTLASAPKAFSVVRLPMLRDIDEARDLSAAGLHLRSRRR